MRSTYIERIQKLSEKLSDPVLTDRTRKINSNTFSRNRRNYFIQKNVPAMKISKQGYLQQRKCLDLKFFLI